jgi:hypothetical protein
MDKIPYDVIINHIVPFTYAIQNKDLLLDIRSFKEDFDLVESTYLTIYNEFILMHDVIKFCNNKKYPVFDIDIKFENILNRSFRIRKMDDSTRVHYIFIQYHRDMHNHLMRKIRVLWGLLLPIQRTRFINYHILDDI